MNLMSSLASCQLVFVVLTVSPLLVTVLFCCVVALIMVASWLVCTYVLPQGHQSWSELYVLYM